MLTDTLAALAAAGRSELRRDERSQMLAEVQVDLADLSALEWAAAGNCKDEELRNAATYALAQLTHH